MLLQRKEVVRATLMRGTLHLTNAEDYRNLRASFTPLLEASVAAVLRERAKGLDVAPLVEGGRAFLEEAPRTFEALRNHLVARHP